MIKKYQSRILKDLFRERKSAKNLFPKVIETIKEIIPKVKYDDEYGVAFNTRMVKDLKLILNFPPNTRVVNGSYFEVCDEKGTSYIDISEKDVSFVFSENHFVDHYGLCKTFKFKNGDENEN